MTIDQYTDNEEDEEFERFCQNCNKVTTWEDGFDMETGRFEEWCTECKLNEPI